MNNKKEWFASWFDSPYYHILYKNRDEAEAQLFIENLVQKLALKKGDKVVDLACGKGRHSFELSSYGLDVLGLDLSANSIAIAKQQKADYLNFRVHDMRNAFGNNEFDAVLNLFTSIGYFEDTNDNFKVIEAVHKSLKPNAWFLIDFFNAHKVLKNLVSSEIKTVEGINFAITRKFDEDRNEIVKSISFKDNDEDCFFEEKVQAIKFEHFSKLLSNYFSIEAVFGNYCLDGFDLENSDRLILLCKKI